MYMVKTLMIAFGAAVIIAAAFTLSLFIIDNGAGATVVSLIRFFNP
jgi:hypothetical protein